MKIRLIFPYIITLTCLLIVFACKDDDDWSPERTNQHVNSWINANMDAYYYWNEYIPENRDYNQMPENFFESLLYMKNTLKGDRFSWIQNNYLELLNSLNGYYPTEIGFEYAFVKTADNIHAVILYVKKGTDAEKKGLKRGMKITTVNGTKITEENYRKVIPAGLNTYGLKILNDNNEEIEVNINADLNYAENPVYMNRVYEEGTKKIGYLVYNFFAHDKGDGTYNYDIELMNVLQAFEDKGITDLVLDLRYNNGGKVFSAQYLASALVKNRNTENIFLQYEYNPKVQASTKKEDLIEKFLDRINNQYSIPKLGDKIDKLYILTGSRTASASELVINSLYPFMEDKIVLIGETTYGKNVASSTFYRKNDNHNKYGMQPIIAKISNSKGFAEYEEGFAPDFEINEFRINMKELGNQDEPLLAQAISLITGKSLPEMVNKNLEGIPAKTIYTSFDDKKSAFQMFMENDKLEVLE